MTNTNETHTKDYFASIIGYETTKQELMRIADTLKNAQKYKDFGAVSPRGLILYGKPGTGKTKMANCLIEASGRPAYLCRRTESDQTFINKMKQVFEDAEANAPSIVFLDDMDKFANSDYQHRDAAEFVTIQSCIDNLRGKEVFVLATANENIRNLPKSLLRPGRFDRQIEVEVPKGDDSVRIITNYLSNKNFAEDFDPRLVAAILTGHSCAALETVVNEAAILAAYSNSPKITTEHMIEACMRAVFHVPADCLYETDPVDLAVPSTKSIVVWHEAGHSVIKELLMPGSIALVSAKSKSRKKNYSGFTINNWLEPEEPLESEISDVLTYLGGKAAVDVVFGLPDTGSSDDIERAYQRLGYLLSKDCIHGFGLIDPPDDYDYDSTFRDAAATKDKRHAVLTNLMEQYYIKAKQLLIANRAFLNKIAEGLSEKSFLTAKDIARIKQEVELVAPKM